MEKLPAKTVERLSQYRRVLLDNVSAEKEHVFSYEIAGIIHNTPEQVRRDLMLIGYSSTLKKGYEIKQLISLIDNILDEPKGNHVCVIGMGNLGRAITNYFSQKREKLKIVAAFDVDEEKINRVFMGVPGFHINDLQKNIEEKNINIAILTLPANMAAEITEQLIFAGVRGIMNYTSKPLNVPDYIYLEEYDMITNLEKIAYFVKKNKNNK